MRRAAELGDAKAHGEMSTRFAFGFADESSYKFSKLFNFSQVGSFCFAKRRMP